jgi:hypothetical protein
MSRSRRRHVAVFALFLASFVSAAAKGQTAQPADGWAGQLQCTLSITAAGYQDTQTHTWTLGGAPTARANFRDYPATWTVKGNGQRTVGTASESWTRDGTSANAFITIYQPIGASALRITPGQAAVKAAGAVRVEPTAARLAAAARAPAGGDADEWRFAYIDAAYTPTAMGGSRSQTTSGPMGWRQPSAAAVAESCTWSFVKSAATGPGYANVETYVDPEPLSTPLWVPNGPARYVVTVANYGPAAANAATLVVPAPVNMSTASVTCAASSGAQCPSNLAVGQLATGIVIPTLPANSDVKLTISGTVTGPLGANVSVTGIGANPSGVRNQFPRQLTATSSRPIAPPVAGTVGRGNAPLSASAGRTGVVQSAPRTGLSLSTATCALAGPAVTIASVSPAHVYLSWPAVLGANSYSVSRSDLGVVPGRALDFSASPLRPTEFLHSTPLFANATYQYAVTAHYAQGCGNTQVTVVPPRPYVPVVRAVRAGGAGLAPGRYAITGFLKPPANADAVLSTTGFLVLGAGLPADGYVVRPSYVQLQYWAGVCARLTDVCLAWQREGLLAEELDWSATVGAGDHAWLVVPYWETDNGRMIDASLGARVTLRVP